VGEGSDPLAPRPRQFRRDPPLLQSLPRQAPQPDEVEARYGVALSELEGEQDHHAREPGDLKEIQASVIAGY
jgi:hypothetical protein